MSKATQTPFNRLTLNFPAKIEQKFWDNYSKKAGSYAKHLATFGLIVFVIFSFIYLNAFPERRQQLLITRFFIGIPAISIFVFLSFFKPIQRILLRGVNYMAGAISIIITISMINSPVDQANLQFMSLMLSLFINYSFIGAKYLVRTTITWTVSFFYLIFICSLSNFDFADCIPHITYLIFINAFGTVTSYFNEWNIRNNFFLFNEVKFQQKQLSFLNKNLQKEVAKKTEEYLDQSENLQKACDSMVNRELRITELKKKLKANGIKQK